MKPFPFSPRLLLPLAAAFSLTLSGSHALAGEPRTPAERAKDAEEAQQLRKSATEYATKTKENGPDATGDFSVDGADKDHETERKELEGVLSTIETQWNAHDIKAVMSNYADEYVNNDGLDKKAVQKLTEDFWKQYPDAHAVSKTKSIRIEGNFATVESRDVSTANCEMTGMNKGELQSVSEGQQYFKRLGNVWRITGDRIDFEKVRVAFGLAKQLNATFTAPEQVRAGKQFSAKLEVALPPGFRAIGSITNQPLTFPQHTPMEKTRVLDTPPILERVMGANNDARNELLTATVILVTPGEKPMGLAIMTRRINVVPDLPEAPDATSTASAHKGGTNLSEASKNSGEASKESKDANKESKDESKSSKEESSTESSSETGSADKNSADKSGSEKGSADKVEEPSK